MDITEIMDITKIFLFTFLLLKAAKMSQSYLALEIEFHSSAANALCFH